MSAKSRRKGVAYERSVAARLTQATGVRCERNLDEVRHGNSGDLLVGSLPLCVQVKVGKRPNLWRALREAHEAAGPGLHPIAVVKMNGSRHEPAVEGVFLPLDDFLEIVGQMKRCGIW